MAWKEIHNRASASPTITNSGICKLYEKQAEVTSLLGSTVECKTDLQKTYHFVGYKCSLQKEDGFPDPACIDVCHLIQKSIYEDLK